MACPPLVVAVTFGDVERVQSLLKSPDINVNEPETEQQMTPLHIASWKNFVEIATLLLHHPTIDVNAADSLKRTPLHYACWYNQLDVVMYMLSTFQSINVNARDRNGITPLHLATWKGHQKIVSHLLQDERIDPNAATTRGTESKQYIMRKRQRRKGKIEERQQQNLDSAPQAFKDYTMDYFKDRSKVTALQCAVVKSDEEITTLLLGHSRTKVLLENDRYKSAVDIAIGRKNIKILKILFSHQGLHNFDAYGKYLSGILDRVQDSWMKKREKNTEMVNIVFEKLRGTVRDQNDPVFNGKKSNITLIHDLAFAGLDQLLKALLRTPTDVVEDINAEDSDNQTPLHLATIRGHTRVVEVLVSQLTLRANVEDKEGQTALQIAIEKNRKTIEKLLLDRYDVKDYLDRLYRDREVYVNAANAILVGAALIASVTFGGWLQPPLGYTSYYEFVIPNPAPPDTYESYASVKQHLSIRVFWVFNSLSFFFSIATVLAGAGAVLPMPDRFIGEELKVVKRYVILTSVLLVSCILFVLGAFGAAGFASLPPILHLELSMIITCTIGVLLCLIILIFFVQRLYHMRPSWFPSLTKSYLFRGPTKTDGYFGDQHDEHQYDTPAYQFETASFPVKARGGYHGYGDTYASTRSGYPVPALYERSSYGASPPRRRYMYSYYGYDTDDHAESDDDDQAESEDSDDDEKSVGGPRPPRVVVPPVRVGPRLPRKETKASVRSDDDYETENDYY